MLTVHTHGFHAGNQGEDAGALCAHKQRKLQRRLCSSRTWCLTLLKQVSEGVVT